MSDFSKTINQVNTILGKTHEAEKGFAKAAEMVENPNLKEYFQEKSRRRNLYSTELVTVIRNLGGTEEEKVNYIGNIHRAWMDIKTALSFDKEEALLEECERGEEYSLEDYKKVLENPELPSFCRNILQKHHDEIAATVRTLDLLEDSVD